MGNLLTHNLLTFYKDLIKCNDISSSLDATFKIFRGILPFDKICLVLMDTNDTLYSRYIASENRIPIKRGSILELNNTVFHSIMFTKKTMVINNYIKYLNQNPTGSIIGSFIENEISSCLIVPILSGDLCIGILIFSNTCPCLYHKRHANIANILASSLSFIIRDFVLVDDFILASTRGFSSLVESKDDNTGGHIERIQEYSKILTVKLSELSPYKAVIDDKYIWNIFNASSLHDIGKVGIPDGILLKQGKLTPEEFEVMKNHTTIGAKVLTEASANLVGRNKDFFTMAIEIALSHHEKYDGTGYPHGLQNEYIPLSARIVAVADVLDALSSQRPYRLPLNITESIEIMLIENIKHFDPIIVDILLKNKDMMIAIYKKFN